VLHGPFPFYDLQDKENHYYEVRPDGYYQESHQYIATSDNWFFYQEDQPLAELWNGPFDRKTDVHCQYLITDETEFGLHCNHYPNEIINKSLDTLQQLVNEIEHVELPQAEMIHIDSPVSLKDMCLRGLKNRKKNTPDYLTRLEYELDIIQQKGFESYFFVMSDLVNWAKQHMIVGPGRGSAAGSLCCYALGITDVDPIEYDLLFERFIDINRYDMPDIDVDFPDIHKPEVHIYLENKYGKDRVAKLGAVGTLAGDGTLRNCCKSIGMDLDDIYRLKHMDGSLIERLIYDQEMGGSGEQICKKHPVLLEMAKVEGHATHQSKHAAGIIVTDKPITEYCGVDARERCAQIEKVLAEERGMLKIDALGLSALTVIDNCLKMIDKPYSWLLNYDRHDPDVLSMIGNGNVSGIFQFSGGAARSFVRTLKNTDKFADLYAITSLARPGPLDSGGAAEWAKFRNGEAEPQYLHPLHEKITGNTYGVIVYQEQVMYLAKELGNMTWKEVTELRKGIGKKIYEYIDKYHAKFIEGCQSHGISQEDAEGLWRQIETMGGYGFNKSHAVAYCILSYMMMVLKHHYPKHFACSWLRTFSNKDNKKDEVKTFLQELVQEGIEYKPYDPVFSGLQWEVVDGKLIGGLTNIKGIGEAKALTIIEKRARGEELTEAEIEKLKNGETPIDDVFAISNHCKWIIDNSESINITSKIWKINDIDFEGGEMEVVVIGQVYEHFQWSMNDPERIEKRGYKWEKQDKVYDIRIQDDTGKLLTRVPFFHYEKLRNRIANIDNGCYVVLKGLVGKGFRMMDIKQMKVIDISSKEE